MRRVHIVVRGSVHGVFFRASCVRIARETGVSGWVRNADDGSVEAVFEGEPAAVDELVAWCRSGPPSAVVTSIEVREEAPAGEDGFRVVR
jgi:acylphosphatase